MFAALVWIQPLVTALQAPYSFASGVAGVLASLGIYRLLAEGFRWLLRKILWLRRLILGKQFLEGTWVGHYLSNGEHRFTIEFIDQAETVPTIHGREVDAEGNTMASWTSDTISVDVARMQLMYSYRCSVFRRNHVQEGLGVFAIVCEQPGEPPTRLVGYAVDVIDGNRDPNTEHKIADTVMPESEALKKAKEIFKLP
jgi:hypothetical protein